MTVLAVTGPIFILIAIGFAAMRFGLFARGETRALGVYVINFALPALLFKSMTQRPAGQLVNFDLLTAYALGSLLLAGCVIGLACWVQKRSLQSAAVLAMGMSMSNSAFIGFPIAQRLMGQGADEMLTLYAIVETVVMLPILMTLAELGGDAGKHWRHVVWGIITRLFKNPMLLSILAGVAVAVLEWQLPLPLGRAIDMLAGTSAPVALFYIGCILAGLNLKGIGMDIGAVAFGKLVLHPLAVFAIFYLLPFDDMKLKQAAVINAAMPMMSVYPILGQRYGKEGICAAALVITTVASFLSISFLIWLH